MNPSSIDTLKNNFFEIQNVNSSFNQYYHLTSPYNAVIETYRSDLDQPYFKISSFSPEHTSHSLIDATELLEKMKNRPLHQHDFLKHVRPAGRRRLLKLKIQSGYTHPEPDVL